MGNNLKEKNLVSLQILRALAVILVVSIHTSGQAIRSMGNDLGFSFSFGGSGVDLFFVISGFIIWKTNRQRIDENRFSKFLISRLTRIVPLYWLATLFVLPLSYVSNHLSNSFSSLAFFKSLLFVPFTNENGGIFPLLDVGWTLNYEIFFYIIFALTLKMSSIRSFNFIIILLLLLPILGAKTDLSNVPAIFYTNPIIIEFAFGVIAAEYFATKREIPAYIAIFAVILAVVFILTISALSGSVATSPWRFAAWGIPSAIIVAGSVSLEQYAHRKAWTPLVTIGNASYSIYLFHTFPTMLIGKVALNLHMQPTTISYIVFVIVGIMLSIVTGCFAYFLVEQPLFRFTKQRALEAFGL